MTTRLPLFSALAFATLTGCPVDEPEQTDSTTDDTTLAEPTDTDPTAADSTGVDDSTTGAPVMCPEPTDGPTIHDSEVEGHEVWTAAGSPHIVDWTVNVRDGATLEIEPCAVVQFAEGHGMNVAFPLTPNTGTLVAEGTAEQPIRFEGQDGARWGHLFVHSPGTARLAYVTFEGGGGVHTTGASLAANGDGTYPRQNPLFVDHVTIIGSKGAGVSMERVASFAEGSTDLVITGSGDETNPYAMVIDEHALDALPRGDYTGNANDAILVNPSGPLRADAEVRDLGVPYVVTWDLVVESGDEDVPTTMTIEPGVTMQFEAGKALEIEHYTGEFVASGILIAEGTAEDPITFTSASANPQPNDWIGLWFGGIVHPSTSLRHVQIDYTGADCGCILLSCSDIDQYEGAVIMSQPPADAFITDSVFRHGGSHGIVLGYEGDAVDMRSANTFEDMAGCPMTQPHYGSCPDPKPSCME